ncbi:DNA-binding transcriptional regulator, MarR family [Parasphingorhabdus marina DSM 22363]|uniref:DNA-binding transcriptional regulator, MarR family n=2 Tax=Parasphingorhabdus marina TaxID=394732 RepID=A0A1N6CUW4_9SPHN|nr:DNA-binding transcriptional regulator, MarR family [Parasphingorhabdus marina DSM 22363]
MHNAYIYVNPIIAFSMLSAYIADMDRTTNLLGALALALTDKMGAELKDIFDRSGETAAAVIVIGYVPGISVQILRQVLDLSHPGTVRVADRLEEDGLVERRSGLDGRTVALHLTRKGTIMRKKLMMRRLDMLEAALEGITTNERGVLADLIAKVLTNLPETEMGKHRICRFCNVQTCSDCPIRGHAI